MNPLIFLDIDGVLNSVSWQKKRTRPSASAYTVNGWRHKIDPETVLHLNYLITSTDAQVVVSSSWRTLMTLGEIRDLLGGHGFTGEIIGETPELYQKPRWDEIQKYLARWGKVPHYIILDDDPMPEAPEDHFVRTDYHRGLTEPDVDQAIALLTLQMTTQK